MPPPIPPPGRAVVDADLDVDALAQHFAEAPAERVVGWAVARFGAELCLASSMSDAVLIDVVTRIDPDIQVVFLDTGFHFAETLATLRRVMVRYRLRVTVCRPEPGPAGPAPDVWAHGPEACCAARKIQPLDRLLAGRRAWLSGLRRADSPERSATQVVERDRRGLIKINPLAAWSDDDVERYCAEHEVVLNPLLAEGYPSIGCWPCTEPAMADGTMEIDPRSGRWAGTTKTECGIHR